jgi:hypothetical protein
LRNNTLRIKTRLSLKHQPFLSRKSNTHNREGSGQEITAGLIEHHAMHSLIEELPEKTAAKLAWQSGRNVLRVT